MPYPSYIIPHWTTDSTTARNTTGQVSPIYYYTGPDVYTTFITSANMISSNIYPTSCTGPVYYPQWPVVITESANYHYYWWEEQVDSRQYFNLAVQRVNICRERTEEENRRLLEAQQLALVQREEAHRRVIAAEQRAKELLLSHLTEEQRKTFTENGWFVVKGGASGDHYQIKTSGYAGNIEVVCGGRHKEGTRLCCHSRGNLPLHDHHMAQMLSLQYDEEQFLRIANRL